MSDVVFSFLRSFLITVCNITSRGAPRALTFGISSSCGASLTAFRLGAETPRYTSEPSGRGLTLLRCTSSWLPYSAKVMRKLSAVVTPDTEALYHSPSPLKTAWHRAPMAHAAGAWFCSAARCCADLICSATCGGRMEGSCKLGAVTTALVEASGAVRDALGTGSSRSKRDTAGKRLVL